MRSTFRILFYVNKQRAKEGRVPIYVRLTVNGKSTFVSSRQTIPLSLWDSAANKAAGKSAEARNVNAELERIRAKLLHHYQRISDRDAYVTAERVKSAYLGMGEEYETLLEALDKFNRDFKQHVGVDRAQSTYRKYDNVRKRLAEFLSEKLHREDIPLKELTETFITDYDLYLRSEKGLTPSCVCIYTKPLKMVVTKAHNAGVIARNPFADYHPKKITKDRGYLIESELQQLMNHKFTFEGYGKVRDMFVFSCFTGLAYIDLKNLTYDHIVTTPTGEQYIYNRRQKTGTPYHIMLLPIAQELIERYRGYPGKIDETRVFPVKDRRSMCTTMKRIAQKCGITKNLSTHIGRHTFGTTVTLEKGVPIETVSEMLGHKQITTTQIYAKLTANKMKEDVRLLTQRIGNLYELTQPTTRLLSKEA